MKLDAGWAETLLQGRVGVGCLVRGTADEHGRLQFIDGSVSGKRIDEISR